MTYQLDKNYPNPFNPVTNIRYGLPVTSHVELRVFDAVGRKISLLVDQTQSSGYYTVVFDSQNLLSGVYFIQLRAVPESGAVRGITRKMTLIK